MIKDTDLRIGNWLYLRKFITIDQQMDWDKDEMPYNFAMVTASVIQGIEDGVNFYEPIPLNEEWLLRFGFEKVEDLTNYNIDYLINGCEYWVQCHKEHNQYLFFGGGNSLCIIIHSIHQLQNLYYALTQAELTLTK